MKSLKLLTVLSVLALASATGAFAQSKSTGPNNPSCTQGTPDCQNYVTTDHSDQYPTKTTSDATMPPNCTQGQVGCENYPTTDHSDDNPALHQGTQPQQ